MESLQSDATAKKNYWISLSKSDILDAFEWQNDEENYENGVSELHIFPSRFEHTEKGESKDNPLSEKIEYIQAGNSYGPNFDESKISEFGLDYLFDESLNSDFNQISWNYSETRSDAREEFAKTLCGDLDGDAYFAALERFKEEVEEMHLDENWKYYEEVEKIEDEWVQNHAEWNRETAASVLKSELVDEDLNIVYKIVWED
jgi:hypothetical protein